VTAFRAAVIGCGRIGSEIADDPKTPGVYSHAGAFDACDATELVAVCDVDSERLRRCADRWGVRGYADVARLLDEQRPEIVSVCTPDETHVDVATLVLQAPTTKAVLLEKPIAIDLAAAQRLVALAERRGVVLAVNYSRRFAPSIIALKAWVSAGHLGEVRVVNGYYTKGLLRNGSHWIDLTRYLAGEIATVTGVDVLRDGTSDATLDIELELRGGGRGWLIGLDDRNFTLFEMDLVGTKGRVRITEAGHVLEGFTVGDSTRFGGYRELRPAAAPLATGLADVLLHAVRDIVECLRSNRDPRCTGHDGVAALAICLAAAESARSGGRPQRLHE